ncbi:chlorhexidine efflux transporter [Lichenihabitans sp. Uapishka_5]|uniref:chlorhexidine efflux transporter n=1 Tax=Lichenihabitans sp. Uapishka_5 TaxID=3037302 RepID=UPI0029E7F9DF|nr:chlorhexidine efflux transporter [Lichenihabitans sp. Uapishka_5]MDX7952450.1 chlorhexidine efflux transporter [Lichenihabitans sp. Uapishka_5]
MAMPVIGLVTGASAVDSGTLSVLISVGAVVANAGWTFVFDRWVPTRQRGLRLRLLNAAGLELLIAAYTIPLTVLITGATLKAALALDAGAIVFFLVYSLLYNAAFDAAMLRLQAHQTQALSR